MSIRYSNSAIGAVAFLALACGGVVPVRTAATPPSPEQMAQLWVDPGDTPRDLFWGIGGKEYAPAPDAVYRIKKKDATGFSVSYDVVGPDDIGWSAKIGPEAQTEVVVSRILWGLGYHQPPVYYLPSWRSSDEDTRKESEARFRPKLASLVREEAFWKWADNPFSGTRELKGLLVVMLMLNSTDLKDDNNSIYSPKESWDGAPRWFLARDVGAALGETGKMYPHRNWLEGFEKHGFITNINGDRVRFDYQGRHQELLRMITPPDVQWASARMLRLSDAQWQDAFRSANYDPPTAERFIRRIKEKIDDGMALRARPAPKDAGH